MSKKNRVMLSITVALIVVFSFAVVQGFAGNFGPFELDGDAVTNKGGEDWDMVYDESDTAHSAVFIEDGDSPFDESYFDQGGSKDVNDIPDWRWDTGDVAPDKDEILHAFAAAYINDAEELIVTFGADRYANNGDAQIGFWFFRGQVAKMPDHTFAGEHHVGDVLVLSDFVKGGKVPSIKVYEWLGVDNLNLIYSADEAECSGGTEPACAIVNAVTVPSPWPYTPKFPDKNWTGGDHFPAGTLYEGAVNLTKLLPFDLGCFSSFLAETRSSQSTDAQLKDFALGNFDLCSIALEKTGDDPSKIGDEVTYTYTITNTGALPLYFKSMDDDQIGNLADEWAAAACADPLPADDNCSFEVDWVIPEGASDPYVNVATVLYTSGPGPDDFGDEVSAEDTWSINLFQPAIALTKTGDELSKIGDTVDYVITLENNSSVDTPDLNCTVTDELVGVDETFTVASGVDYEINVTDFEIPADAADPFVNTARVLCSPEGFPNEYTAEASWSTNLFQPAIALSKTGDELSKIGDMVDYVITLENNSSADTPDLTCTITDAVVSVNETFDIASGEEKVINVNDFEIPEDAADPFPNTAYVTCSPAGFPNVYEDEASWEINLFQPAIELTKTGTELSKIGDPVDYVITLENNSSDDTPDLTCTVTDTVVGVDETFTVASGVDEVIEVNGFIIPEDATDPFPNTATVTCSPAGFPNVYEDEAGWEVNLFQPSITLEKTGTELSKATDDVTYDIVITNTSSSDTPDLVLDEFTDTLVAGVAFPEACEVLSTGEVCQFSYTYTVKLTDPDPLVNWAEVHYHPAGGFTNDIWAKDGHAVNLFQPSITLEKTGTELSKATDDVTYDIVITNTSSFDTPDLLLDMFTDSLVPGLVLPAECGILSYEEVCSFSYTYTVQAGDPDPLLNVAEVHYHPAGGFTNDIWDMDDHSVNLFQPAIVLTKTGDELSKIGDLVDYVITLENNSSDDTPDLECTVTDAVVGVDETFTVASGADHVINVNDFEIPAGAADPFPNTAYVTCSPAGFPNTYTASDTWEINLFQPEIAVTKTGDELSKIGDPVGYTITVYNNSSADTPTMYFDISDAMLGIDEKDVVIANGGSYIINVTDYKIPAGASDPYKNTVDVFASFAAGDEVADFPNTFEASDTWEVNLFQPQIAVTKTGDAYSKTGDTIHYTVTLSNNSSTDTPAMDCVADDSLMGVIFDGVLPLGDTVLDLTHIVTPEEGAAEALVNTVTLTCSPEGFDNVLTATDSHTVDIIHPSFTVTKVCDAEPIPYEGPAFFTVTIANTGDVSLDIEADDGIGVFTLAAGASQSFPVSMMGPFTPGGTADNTVTATWTLPEMYGLANTETKTASDSCDILQVEYETAYAMGDAAACFIDLGANNWGWVNGDGAEYILPGTYEWPVYAGAAQCDISKGTLVGTVTVTYDGTDVFVEWNIESPYVLGDTHVYAGLTQIPPTGFSPGRFEIYSPFNGEPIYIIAHAVVGVPK